MWDQSAQTDLHKQLQTWQPSSNADQSEEIVHMGVS